MFVSVYCGSRWVMSGYSDRISSMVIVMLKMCSVWGFDRKWCRLRLNVVYRLMYGKLIRMNRMVIYVVFIL